MVAKSKEVGAKKPKVQLDKLRLDKETVKTLTPAEQKQIKGGGACYRANADAPSSAF